MKVYQDSSFNMGTRFNLLLPGIDIPEGDSLFHSCTHELKRLENMLSCFIPESEVSSINAHGFQQSVEVSNELFELLERCIEYFNMTQGAFDISLGKLIDQWSENQQDQDMDNLHTDTGADKIILDREKMTVRYTSPSIKINLGGIGKGYALDKVRKLLSDFGITSAFISFGESSVSCIGKHPHGDFWPLGIQDYYNKDKSIATLKLVDQSISTSGNIGNNNHIIDPTNKKPGIEKKMITVKSSSAITAEVLSTALVVANKVQKGKIIQEFQDIEVIEVTYSNKTAGVSKYNSIE